MDSRGTENITAGQIAARLNDLGVSPVFSPLWHQGVVKYLLANPIYTGCPVYNKQNNSRFMEFRDGQVKSADRSKPARKRAESDQIRPEKPEFPAMIEQEVFDKAQAKLAATKTRAYRAPKTAHLWLKGFVICAKCGKPMRAQSGNERNALTPGYLCSGYARWGTRNPSGCGHFRVEHDEIESLVLDYLTEVAPQVKALLDATQATDLEAAKPLLTALSETNKDLGFVWHDMAVFAEKYLPSKAHRKAVKRMGIESLYEAIYSRVRPRIEKTIAEKEVELEALLDGFAGLSPKLKERANKRGETLQKEIDALRRDLEDLRVPWERLQADLVARQQALERTLATLNQEGHFRQKAEALKTVIDRIVCHFGVGKPCTLKSIDVYAAEDGAVRPLTFPVNSLQMDWCLRAFVVPCPNPSK